MARDQKVIVSVDASEKQAIVSAAKQARISTAQWARESMLAAVAPLPATVGGPDAENVMMETTS